MLYGWGRANPLWRNQTGLEKERGLGYAGSEVCTTQPTGVKPESQQEGRLLTRAFLVTHVNVPELFLQSNTLLVLGTQGETRQASSTKDLPV